MQNDPRIYQESLAVREKITVKKRMSTELLNLLLVLIISFTLFSTLGKKIIIPKFGNDYIKNINEVFIDYANKANYPSQISSNYGFVDIDEDLYVEDYVKVNDESKEVAYENYLDARLEILSKVRANETFQVNNAKFNALHMFTFFIAVFIPLFIFEFLIPVFDQQSRNLGMMHYKTELVNLSDNQNPNKFKLILRFFIILLFEHLLIRLFFGNAYFIVLILLHIIFVYITKDKVLLHDLFSGTKVINSEFAGYSET